MTILFCVNLRLPLDMGPFLLYLCNKKQNVMKKAWIVMVLVGLLSCSTATAQAIIIPYRPGFGPVNEEKVYDVVEQMPSFPGGPAASTASCRAQDSDVYLLAQSALGATDGLFRAAERVGLLAVTHFLVGPLLIDGCAVIRKTLKYDG